MRTKLCARQALRVAVGPRWWQGMVWWQAMARRSRSATVRVLLLSDAAATRAIATVCVMYTWLIVGRSPQVRVGNAA